MLMLEEIYEFNNVTIGVQITGVYCIFNSKYYYTGQSKDIRKRWRRHRSNCIKNKHENSFVQSVYNKYLEDDPYKFQILEICKECDLTKQETYWVREYGKRTGLICMNLRDPIDTSPRSENVRAKIIYQFDSNGNLLNT